MTGLIPLAQAVATRLYQPHLHLFVLCHRRSPTHFTESCAVAGAPGGVTAAVGAGRVGDGSAGGCEHEVDGGVAVGDLPVVLRAQGTPGVVRGGRRYKYQARRA